MLLAALTEIKKNVRNIISFLKYTKVSEFCLYLHIAASEVLITNVHGTVTKPYNESHYATKGKRIQ